MSEGISEILSLIRSFVLAYTPKLVGAILIIWIGFKLVNRLDRYVEKVMVKSKIDKSIKSFAISLINMILKIVLMISAAGLLWVETASFVAMLWAMWLAIWLALQGSLSNFAGWVLILWLKPYKIWDFVDIQWEKGTVKEINIFTTSLVTPLSKIAIIPNGAIANGNIINNSKEWKLRVDVSVWVSYDSDFRKAMEVIKEVVNKNKLILKDPAPIVWVENLNDSSVDIAVKTYCKPGDYWTVFFAVQEDIKEALDKNKIEIPFPQRVVHMKKD